MASPGRRCSNRRGSAPLLAMRLLVLHDDSRFCALLRHHLACRWEELDVVEHRPSSAGELEPDFLALGFDAVVVDADCPRGQGLAWLRQLAARPGFAPIVFLSHEPDDDTAREALACGAHAVLGRSKLEHEALIAAFTTAFERAAERRAERRTSAEALSEERFSGARVPGYRRIRQLSSGPVSDLFLAESEAAGQLVVLKVARDRHADDLDQSFRRFLQEYEIVRRIRHPGIVRLYDLGVSDAHAYLVMEYFPRGDLRQRMNAGLEPREALRLALEIARALEAVHAAGVLHRDLKPGNVMLRADGGIALIDFGLAKDAYMELDLTDHGMIFGTPHYMSPEQGHGEPIDVRSDLYSLGVILYEMLTRTRPYVAENPMAIIYQHRRAPIPRLPETLATLQPLIDGLLAKSPEDRFGSATAVCAQLRRYLADWPEEVIA